MDVEKDPGRTHITTLTGLFRWWEYFCVLPNNFQLILLGKR